MKLQAIVESAQHESKIVQGEATRHMTYASHHRYADEFTAKRAFANSVAKLLNVNAWSALSSLSANFRLYNSVGRSKPDGPIEIGDFIQIDLPGPTPQNWVQVIHWQSNENLAEFTVQPCPDPLANQPEQIAHFFSEQARSTFRVELAGDTLSAFEIGKHEAINNHQPQAGERGLVNTIITEAGWLDAVETPDRLFSTPINSGHACCH